MDYTLISARGDLRPKVTNTFCRLVQDGHQLYIWSGIGIRKSEVETLGLDVYVQGVYLKPVPGIQMPTAEQYISQLQAQLRRRELPLEPDLVVDDYPEFASAHGGIAVHPYIDGDLDDLEMDRVYRLITVYSTTGECQEAGFYLKIPEGT